MLLSAERSSLWPSMHKCSKCRNIIMIECWNQTKDEVYWWWGNWTNRKFVLGNDIDYYQKRLPFCKYTEKFPITDPPKVWVFSFLFVNGNGKFASAIMKKFKTGSSLAKYVLEQNFQLQTPSKFGSLAFQMLIEMENLVSHYGKNKKLAPTEKLKAG